MIKLPLDISQLQTDISAVLAQFDVKDPTVLAAIRRDKVPRPLLDRLQHLYLQLVAPLAVSTTTERLIIAPDSSLFGVPWVALRDRSSKWLGEDYEIVEVPSILTLVDAGRPALPPSQALIVGRGGAVTASDAQRADREATVAQHGLPPLRAAAREVSLVRDALRGWNVKLLVDEAIGGELGIRAEAPSFENIRRYAPVSEIVHIVAHGVYDPRDPMRSALFIPGKGDAPYVTAADLMEIDLSRARLVILSACQTGVRGQQVSAEPMGMSRAFFARGARSLLATSWSVDDRSTLVLLRSFYRELVTGKSISTALSIAQSDARKRHSHPYYWAAFTLNGDWR